MQKRTISSKSIFSKKSVVDLLAFQLEKKMLNNFSKSQPMRKRLLPKHKKLRVLNQASNMLGIPGVVIRVENDPYRSSGVALIYFMNNTCSYYRNIHNLELGSSVFSSLRFDTLSDYKRGNASTLWILPTSLSVNQIQVSNNRISTYSKSAGTFSTILRKNTAKKIVFLQLPSGIVKQFQASSFATIGMVGNIKHSSRVLYKAGQNRWLGKRPIVRGVAKNPFDHPHGGGEGKKSQNMFPKTFWGKKLKWRKTSRSK